MKIKFVILKYSLFTEYYKLKLFMSAGKYIFFLWKWFEQIDTFVIILHG